MLPSIGPHHISSAVCLQSLHTGMHHRDTWGDSSFSACVTCSRSSVKLGLAVRNKAMAALNRRTPELHVGRGAHHCLQGIHRNLSQFVQGTEQQEDSAWVLAPLWASEYVPKIDFRHQRPVERAGLAITVCQLQHGKTRHLSTPPLAALKRRPPFGLCNFFGSIRAHGHCPDHASLPTDVQLGGFCPSPCFALPRRPIARAVSKTAAA